MSETTKLPASFSNGAVFESSTAFLMLQKNKKRQTTMTDDVFRIFRRTGKKINEIANRIESERNLYLKDSYSNKNTLYKELSGIANIKERHSSERRRAKMSNHMPPLPHFSSFSTSDLIYRPVKSQLGRQKIGEEPDLEPEKRMNVNVLKRCECCRRLAFRYKEMREKQERDNEEEEKARNKKGNEQDEGQKNSSETQKLTDENLASVNSLKPTAYGEDTSGRKSSRLSYHLQERLDSRKISISEVVPTSFNSLRKQSKAAIEIPPRKMTVSGAPVTAPTSPTKQDPKVTTRSRSYSVLMNSDRSPTMVGSEPTPSPLSRQKIRVKFENPNSKEKLKIHGYAWSNHVRKLQGQDTEEKQAVVTLSKAYLAFKKLLRKMEEERKREEEAAQNEDNSPNTSSRNSPIPRNRFQNTAVSIAASLRWQPRKNTSERTCSIVTEDDHVIDDVTGQNIVEEVDDSDDFLGTFTVLNANS